jgi:nucleoside-diphosphate-sugar epimerase
LKILLTGGSGFIGTNLRETLGRRHEVLAPSSRELDVTDAAGVDRFLHDRKPDVVVHAAVRGGDTVVETTLRGYWNLARHASSLGRMYYFGSGAEYGKDRDLAKVGEDEIGRRMPRDGYGFAKLLCTEDARRRRRITNLRLFGVYGPHEGYLFRFISNSIVKALLGLPIVVRQDVVFDYLHVDDLCRIVEALLERDSDVTDLNVTPTESISLREILGIVSASSRRRPSVSFQNEGLNHEYTGDNRALRDLLPDLTFASYPDGIGRLYDFYSEKIESIDREAVARDDYLARTRPRTADRAAS